MGTVTLGHIDSWTLWLLDTVTPRHCDSWTVWLLDTVALGHCDSWTLWLLDTVTFGQCDSWTLWLLDPLTYGIFDALNWSCNLRTLWLWHRNFEHCKTKTRWLLKIEAMGHFTTGTLRNQRLTGTHSHIYHWDSLQVEPSIKPVFLELNTQVYGVNMK